jgi:hypothetical protein
LIEGICYLDEAAILGMNYDNLPGIVFYEKNEKSYYPLKDSFSAQGIER